MTGGCTARNTHGRVAVVAHRLHGTADPAGAGKRRQRHGLALAVEHRQFEDVFRLHARLRLGLYHHALQAPSVGKVIHISGAQRRRDGVVDGSKTNPLGTGLVAVNIHLQLWCIFQTVGTHTGKHLALGGHAQHLVACGHQSIMAIATAVLQPEGEARADTQLRNGWRTERKNKRIADTRQRPHGTASQSLSGLAGTFALTPVLERHKREPGVLSLAREAEAHHRHHALDFRLLEHEVFDLFHHGLRALQRGAWRQLDVDQQTALVFVGQERGRQAHIQNAYRSDQRHIHHHHPATPAQQLGHPALIALGAARKAPVEPAKESGFGMGMSCHHRLEQRGAQRWRKRQGHKGRKTNRHGHHCRELAVNVAHRASKESQWHKHRYQHHGNTDDGTGNLAHGLARGLQRRQPLFAHDALDVFNDHDGIVHHDTDHQHHAEHRQHVDREPHGQQCAKGTQQRHRHHDGRDDGVADVLQEQEHHQEHQHDGFQQRHRHLLDRNLDEVGTVVRHRPGHAGRKVLFQLGHAFFDRFRSRQRIA